MVISALVGGLAAAASYYTANKTTDAAHDDQVQRLRQEVVNGDKTELRAVLDQAGTRLALALSTAHDCQMALQRRADSKRLIRRLNGRIEAVTASQQRLLIRLRPDDDDAPRHTQANQVLNSYGVAVLELTNAQRNMELERPVSSVQSDVNSELVDVSESLDAFHRSARGLAGTRLR